MDSRMKNTVPPMNDSFTIAKLRLLTLQLYRFIHQCPCWWPSKSKPYKRHHPTTCSTISHWSRTHRRFVSSCYCSARILRAILFLTSWLKHRRTTVSSSILSSVQYGPILYNFRLNLHKLSNCLHYLDNFMVEIFSARASCWKVCLSGWVKAQA